MKWLEIPVKIYSRSISCAIGYNDVELFPLIDKKLKGWCKNKAELKVIKDRVEGCGGLAYMFEGGHLFLWVRSFPENANSIAVLSHEIFHIAEYILDHIGMELCWKTREAYAYLIEYITREIFENL